MILVSILCKLIVSFSGDIIQTRSLIQQRQQQQGHFPHFENNRDKTTTNGKKSTRQSRARFLLKNKKILVNRNKDAPSFNRHRTRVLINHSRTHPTPSSRV